MELTNLSFKEEKEILSRFINGKNIENNEEFVIRKYSILGFCSGGKISFRTGRPQSALTNKGKVLLGFS